MKRGETDDFPFIICHLSFFIAGISRVPVRQASRLRLHLLGSLSEICTPNENENDDE